MADVCETVKYPFGGDDEVGRAVVGSRVALPVVFAVVKFVVLTATFAVVLRVRFGFCLCG